MLAAKLNAAELLGGASNPLIGGLDAQNTTAIAVDQASSSGTPLGQGANGDVYLQNGSSIASLTTPVR